MGKGASWNSFKDFCLWKTFEGLWWPIEVSGGLQKVEEACIGKSCDE